MSLATVDAGVSETAGEREVDEDLLEDVWDECLEFLSDRTGCSPGVLETAVASILARKKTQEQLNAVDGKGSRPSAPSSAVSEKRFETVWDKIPALGTDALEESLPADLQGSNEDISRALRLPLFTLARTPSVDTLDTPSEGSSPQDPCSRKLDSPRSKDEREVATVREERGRGIGEADLAGVTSSKKRDGKELHRAAAEGYDAASCGKRARVGGDVRECNLDSEKLPRSASSEPWGCRERRDAGVGVTLHFSGSELVIATIATDSSLAKAAPEVAPGWRVLALDGIKVGGRALATLQRATLGPAGSGLRVRLCPPDGGTADVREVTLKREGRASMARPAKTRDRALYERVRPGYKDTEASETALGEDTRSERLERGKEGDCLPGLAGVLEQPQRVGDVSVMLHGKRRPTLEGEGKRGKWSAANDNQSSANERDGFGKRNGMRRVVEMMALMKEMQQRELGSEEGGISGHASIQMKALRKSTEAALSRRLQDQQTQLLQAQLLLQEQQNRFLMTQMMALQKDKQKSAAEQRDSSHHGSGQQEQGGSEREVPPPSSTADVVREQLSACGGLSLHVHIHANAPFGSTEPTATAVVASTGQKAEVQATSAPVPPPPPAPPPVSIKSPPPAPSPPRAPPTTASGDPGRGAGFGQGAQMDIASMLRNSPMFHRMRKKCDQATLTS